MGGGDGGIINELFKLENPPKFATMVDIDDMVMEACNKFMPSVCGKFLDKKTREGPNYKVIVGCAIKFLQEAKVLRNWTMIIRDSRTKDLPKFPMFFFVYFSSGCRSGV